MDDIAKLNDVVPIMPLPLPQNQLCSICSTIDFQKGLFNYCTAEFTADGRHFHRSRGAISLGTVQRILENNSCPACRLISSCIASYGKPTPPISHLRILPRAYLFESRDCEQDPGIYSNLPPVRYARRWLDIEACRRDIGVMGTGCEYVSVGAFIPAAPPNFCNEGELFTSGKHSQYIYGRQVSPAVDIELVRKWMGYCTGNHTEHFPTLFVNPQAEKDIRLIDVQTRQLVTGNLGFEYMALSYVWGPDTKPVLTKSTLEKYSSPGSLTKNNIPLTIWDTMELVADLSQRYLWVDSVCIIQDDLVDKQRELPMMGEIYNLAMLVIIAAVDNAHSGLPGRGGHKRQWYRPTEVLHGFHFTTGQPEINSKLTTAIWNTRGWAFQEAQLARRTLILTQYQVYWNCRQESWCEDRFTEFLDIRHIPFSHNSLFSLARDPFEVLYGILTSLTTTICPLWEYCQNVEAFSMRSLSNRADAIWAFFGILKILAPKFPQRFVWGMPKDHLDAALLWETTCSCAYRQPLVIPIGKGEWQELVIPSWCWLSKGSRAWYKSCGSAIKSMVEWHEPMQYYRPKTACGTCQELRRSHLAGLIIPADNDLAGPATSEFALLHFTARTAILRIHISVRREDRSYPKCFITSATVSLADKDVGTIRVPQSVFNDTLVIQGEFVLLSTAVECKSGLDELPDEIEVPKYNIMLIEWRDNETIAYRVAWMEIAKSVWDECETKEKNIVLG